MSYTLQVYGFAWGGFRGTYSYTLDTGTALAIAGRKDPFASADAARCAGDFADLIDWRLIETSSQFERKGSTLRRVTVQKTLRGYRNGMTPARFAKREG